MTNPHPARGGSYTREADGTLKPADAPKAPATPKAAPKPAPKKEA
jgi:hypothetical protein